MSVKLLVGPLISKHAHDFRMVDLPGYMGWSSRKLREGESEALIAHQDASSASLLPEDAAKMTDKDSEEILAQLRTDLQ